MLNGAVAFKGNSVIYDNLQSLYGQKTKDEDNYLTNFVIEDYLELIASKGMSQGTKVEFLGWESFEKGFSKGSVQEYLKGKAPLMEQDIVLVPCNPSVRKHWFLLVLPKEKQIVYWIAKQQQEIKRIEITLLNARYPKQFISQTVNSFMNNLPVGDVLIHSYLLEVLIK